MFQNLVYDDLADIIATEERYPGAVNLEQTEFPALTFLSEDNYTRLPKRFSLTAAMWLDCRFQSL